MAVSDRCQGCGACLLTCPTHAIRPHGNPLLVLADLCTGCLECLDVCPVDAIDVLDSIDTFGAIGLVDHPLEPTP
ncbi:DUF362 domain-containing protein [Streptacidiphilus sp. MAP12-20]|uniref:DUF362 domain-containing protein n=1 Tax=Streptacidiphilus sp. MAP12-20 TaxID=3156299 RepID=UPI0035159D31